MAARSVIFGIQQVIRAPMGSVGMALAEDGPGLLGRRWTVGEATSPGLNLHRRLRSGGSEALAVRLARRGAATAITLDGRVDGARMPRILGSVRRLQCRLAVLALSAHARSIHRSGPPGGPDAPRRLREELRARGLTPIELPIDDR